MCGCVFDSVLQWFCAALEIQKCNAGMQVSVCHLDMVHAGMCHMEIYTVHSTHIGGLWMLRCRRLHRDRNGAG